MTTFQDQSVLSEIHDEQPIPLKTRQYFRRLLQVRIHELVLQAFMDQEETEGLTQKQLAGRLETDPAQINRWLHTAGNWELDSVADLLLGMRVRLNELSVTPIVDLVDKPKEAEKKSEQVAAVPIQPLHLHVNESMQNWESVGRWLGTHSNASQSYPYEDPTRQLPPSGGIGAQ